MNHRSYKILVLYYQFMSFQNITIMPHGLSDVIKYCLPRRLPNAYMWPLIVTFRTAPNFGLRRLPHFLHQSSPNGRTILETGRWGAITMAIEDKIRFYDPTTDESPFRFAVSVSQEGWAEFWVLLVACCFFLLLRKYEQCRMVVHWGLFSISNW